MRPDDLDSHTRLLQRLAPRDERRQEQARERAVVEQQQPQLVPIDGDVAHRLGDHGGHEHRLAGEQVQLAEEAGGTVADDLVSCRVEDRGLAFEDRDERVAQVADAVKDLADLGGALLAVRGKCRQLRVRQHRAERSGHPRSLPGPTRRAQAVDGRVPSPL